MSKESSYSFGLGGPTWNGMPLWGGAIPVTFGNTKNVGAGKVYYVNPTTGLDGNRGLSMAKPLATLAAAEGKMVSNNHDMVVLSATSGHALTDELAITNNRGHFFGLDAVGRYYGQRSRVTMGVTTGTAIAIIKNTGVGNTFSNIKFDSSDTLPTSLYAFADGGEYTVINNCEIYKSTNLNITGAAELLMNGDSSYIVNCTIGSNVNAISGAIIRPCVLLNRTTIANKVCRDVTFENTMFWRKCGNTANRFVYGSGATDVERMLLFKNCLFFNTKLASAIPAQNVGLASTQTEGYVLLWGCTSVGGATAMSTTTGVYVDSSVPSAATSGISVQAS